MVLIYLYIPPKSLSIFSPLMLRPNSNPLILNCDSRNSSLQSLNLRNNRIGDEGIESIAEGLTMSFKEMRGWQAEFVIEMSVEIVEDVLI